MNRNAGLALASTGLIEVFLAIRHGHVFGIILGVVATQWAIAMLLKISTDPRRKRIPLMERQPIRQWCLVGFLVVLIGIRLATWNLDTRYRLFPKECLVSKEGCVRIVGMRDFPVRNENLEPLIMDLSAQQVENIIMSIHEDSYAVKWASKTVVEDQKEIHLHYQETTRIFGFPDNVAIKIFCDENEKANLWVHSEVRLGRGDLGKNYQRVESLLNEIKHKASRYHEIIEPSPRCWNTDKPVWVPKHKANTPEDI